MHQWLAARKHHPLHLEFAEAGSMRLQISRRDFTYLTNPPDIAHHTSAVAAAMGQDHKNGKFVNLVGTAGGFTASLNLQSFGAHATTFSNTTTTWSARKRKPRERPRIGSIQAANAKRRGNRTAHCSR